MSRYIPVLPAHTPLLPALFVTLLIGGCEQPQHHEHLHTDELTVDTALLSDDPMLMGASPSTGPSDALRGLFGKCMDVAGNSTANGARIQLWECNASAAQKFKATGGSVRTLGKCIGARGGSSASGTRIELQSCTGSAAQTWTYNGGSLMNQGKCLDVLNNGTANGTAVQLFTCNTATTAQEWRYVDGTFRTPSGKCLDVSGGASASGTPLQIYSCNGTSAQRFVLQDMALVGTSGKCIDITNNSQVNGTALQLYTCNGSAAQKWKLDRNDLKSTAGLCVDVDNASPNDGTRIKLWSCNGSAPQQDWFIADRVAAPNAPVSARPASFPQHCAVAGSCARSSGNGAHTGADWMIAAGTPVWSVCDGSISYVTQPSSVSNRLVIVQCDNYAGYGRLYAYYGHIDASVASGTAVSRGQRIGSISNWGSNSHLHFGLSTQRVTSGWGYATLSTSTPVGCSGDATRRSGLRPLGWLDADSFADAAGWWGASSTGARACP